MEHCLEIWGSARIFFFGFKNSVPYQYHSAYVAALVVMCAMIPFRTNSGCRKASFCQSAAFVQISKMCRILCLGILFMSSVECTHRIISPPCHEESKPAFFARCSIPLTTVSFIVPNKGLRAWIMERSFAVTFIGQFCQNFQISICSLSSGFPPDSHCEKKKRKKANKWENGQKPRLRKKAKKSENGQNSKLRKKRKLRIKKGFSPDLQS